MRKGFVCAVLVSTLSSCGLLPPKWVSDLKQEGVRQPVQEAYHLKDESFNYNELIDTNAVYISTNDWVFTNQRGKVVQGETIAYDFIRFSNHGLAFISRFNYQKPSVKEVNSFNNGQFVYYTTEGDMLKLEFYNHDRGYFQYWYGRIKNDGIYFYKYKGRPWGTSTGKLNFIYRKEPIEVNQPLNFPGTRP